MSWRPATLSLLKTTKRCPLRRYLQSSQASNLVSEPNVCSDAIEHAVDTVTFSKGGEPKVRRRRVKKAFSDLPSSYSPSGIPALPLPAWGNEGETRRGKALVPRLIPADMAPINVLQHPQLPTTQLANEIVDNLKMFPHCVLLTRVGSFYESYFDQAEEVARLLSIKLTSKSWGGRRVPMCGFPLAHLDRYLKVLVPTHKRFVAICDEFKRRDGTFERRVVRVVTPGTLIDESFVDPFENNYLMAIAPSDTGSVGMAWIDVATGEFLSQQVSEDILRDEIARIRPREVVSAQRSGDGLLNIIQDIVQENSATLSYVSPTSDSATLSSRDATQHDNLIASPLDTSDVDHVNTFSPAEMEAIALLTMFLQGSLLEHMPEEGLMQPTRQYQSGRMQIDSNTINALEIRQELREGGVSGSLLSAVRRTATPGGTRLLERWLCSPSTSVQEIVARQSIVALFRSRPHFRANMVQLLKETADISRLLQKFLLGKGDTDELLALKNTITVWNRMKNATSLEKTMDSGTNDVETVWDMVAQLMGRLEDLAPLAEIIGAAVDDRTVVKEDTASEIVDGLGIDTSAERDGDFADDATLLGQGNRSWTIRPQFSKQLQSLHRKLKKLQKEKVALEASLRLQTNAPSLSLQITAFQGCLLRIQRLKEAREMKNATELGLIEISHSKTSRTYFLPAWTALGNAILETQAAILSSEKAAFLELRNEVKRHSALLRRNARIVDELDVLTSFAKLAEELSLVRPVVNDSLEYHVVGGRHPVVEIGLNRSGRNFVPNDVDLGPRSRLQIITGPNMGGKSTLLRQTAVIAIMAQIGSFVPAEAARLGVIDAVFSRVGAKDDIYRDRSTFMVEMLETAEILKRATNRSLVIMDEVGRGTTVQDGIAIAFAAADHLYRINQSRALFATHFHDVADMFGYTGAGDYDAKNAYGSVGFFCTDVDETEDGYFAYSHRMRTGVNRDSHGLKVARMAGLPKAAIDVATHIVARRVRK